MELTSFRPFGPTIYRANCPEDILIHLNEYVEENESTWFPNLLERDIQNIYVSRKVSDQIGLTNLLETLGNHYLVTESDLFSRKFERLKLKRFDAEYYDCWINRYYAGDQTPIHHHDSILSGVIFLKIPGEINHQSTNKLNGKLQFVYGEENIFCPNLWTPEQEDGMILLFPSWLNHLVYSNNLAKERRTLSFNLTS